MKALESGERQMKRVYRELFQDPRYSYVPEEQLDLLPGPLREAFFAAKQIGEEALAKVPKELKNIERIANSFPAMVSLRHIYDRLSVAPFNPTMDAVLDHDMLTSAFAITYVRLQEGGIGSGFSRDALPKHLRKVHDDLLEVRRARFAHHAGHDSIGVNLELQYQNKEFDIRLAFRIGMHVQGALEWKELVEFIENLLHTRLEKQLDRMQEKTGYVWRLDKQPPAEEVEKE